MATGDQLNFVKSHRKNEDVPGRVVYIIRDGRDVYVSYAKYRVAYEGVRNYVQELERLVRSEAWGVHERTWRTNGVDIPILYNELNIVTIRDMLERLTSQYVSCGNDALTTFRELHKKWPNFFRRGVVGSHKDEMPNEIQKIFWKSKIHHEVMERYGFA
jgi:hypothetical protein